MALRSFELQHEMIDRALLEDRKGCPVLASAKSAKNLAISAPQASSNMSEFHSDPESGFHRVALTTVITMGPSPDVEIFRDCRTMPSSSEYAPSVTFSERTYHTVKSRLGPTVPRLVLEELHECVLLASYLIKLILIRGSRQDEYAQLLRRQKLWPVDPMVEQNWSGRGQHAKFEKDEQNLINIILEVQDDLGSTRTAVVQSVKCRRILLARNHRMREANHD
jgi:hypothetical protein